MAGIDRAYMIAQRDRWETILTTAQDTLAEAMASTIQSYELETTEGRQKVTDKQLAGLETAVASATKWFEYWCRRLDGNGIVAMKLRRKPGE
jgi:hypothetical protein